MKVQKDYLALILKIYYLQVKLIIMKGIGGLEQFKTMNNLRNIRVILTNKT